MTEPKPGGQRYSLRESSKLTPRYREYIGGDEVGTTAAAAQSQQQGQAVQEHKLRSVKSEIKSTEKPTPKQKQRQQQQKRTSDSTAAEIQETSSFKRHLITGGGPCSGPLISRGRTAIARHGIPGKDPPFSKRTHQPNEGTQKVVVEEEEEEVNQPTEDEEMQEDEGEEQEEDTFDDDFPIGAEQEVSTSGYIKEETGQGQFLKQISTGGIKIRGPKDYAVQSVHPLNRRFSVQAADLSDELKTNLRKLKNVLKLPKARRFVLCEFFYSGVDQQIFLAENEFLQLMRESFPNLKCIKLRKQEWREIRRLIGKPRRCSQAFLDEERSSLEDKRQKIRDIYNGTCTSLTEELSELPANLPRPPVVGQKIYARVRFPKDGIYAATVDAVTDDGYRLLFDDENIPTCVSKDYEVMFDQPAELLSINYFIEQNRANRRSDANKTATAQFGHHLLYPASGNGFLTAPTPVIDATGKMVSVQTYMGQQQAEASANMGLNSKISIAKDEKVGNFPVRMLVILVKLCKVIEYKKQLIAQLTMMNDTLEKMNMLGNEYPEELKVQFSQIVLDLETVNRLFRNYLAALQTHYNTLLPHLSEPQPTDRPELLRRTCNTHAFQIVKHCNTELNVRDKRILHLITSLTSIMLQLRTIGLSKKKFNISDMNLLSESLKQIRTQIVPNNSATFQDFVEVHMKQMLRMMLNK